MTVQVALQEKSAIYQGTGKSKHRGAKQIFRLLLVLGGLLAAHFLNVYLQWSLISRELARKPSFRSPEYTFIGFSPFHQEEMAAARRLPNAAPEGRIYAYFDLFHPAGFMVWNNGAAGDFFDLGPVLVALPAGASRVAFFPAAVLLLRQGEKTVAKNFGGSILGSFWVRSVNEKNGGMGGGVGLFPGSYVLKPARESPSLRIPYLVYFYLPLALIVILIATSGAGMATAFFYYSGMFFLFDFEKLFVAIPLDWLFNVLGIGLPDPWVKVLAVALMLFFLSAAMYGLLSWRSREMAPGAKWIVLFFLLLPLALFF